jgi:hypothetical protein
MGQHSEGKEKAKGNQKSGGKQKHTTTEDGPEMLRLQRSRVQGYLSKVLAKRAEMSAPLQKPFVPWRCPEVVLPSFLTSRAMTCPRRRNH